MSVASTDMSLCPTAHNTRWLYRYMYLGVGLYSKQPWPAASVLQASIMCLPTVLTTSCKNNHVYSAEYM